MACMVSAGDLFPVPLYIDNVPTNATYAAAGANGTYNWPEQVFGFIENIQIRVYGTASPDIDVDLYITNAATKTEELVYTVDDLTANAIHAPRDYDESTAGANVVPTNTAKFAVCGGTFQLRAYDSPTNVAVADVRVDVIMSK